MMPRSFYILFALFLLCAAPAPAKAANDPAFTIQGVTVDVTAANSANARKQAFQQAEKIAFEQLLDRLMSKTQRDAFILPESPVISTLIQDYEITEEQLSRVRYIGTYTFRFKDKEVRELMAQQGARYTDVSSKPVLVLPFYQWGAQTILWNEQNPFFAAWKRTNTYQGLVPVILPIGDLMDVSDIGQSDALSYDPQKLVAMTKRYRAGESVILVAIPRWTENAVMTGETADKMPSYIDIALYRTDRAAPEFSRSLQIRPSNGDTTDTLFDKAVQSVRKILQDEWKTRTTVDATQGNTLKVRVRFSSIQEWVDTQKALGRVQGINNMKLLSLTPSQASLELTFQGTAQRLRLALSQADMTLTTPMLQFNNPYITNAQQYGAMQSPLIYDLYLNKYKKTY